MKKLILLIPFAFLAVTGLQIITHTAQAQAQSAPSIFNVAQGLKDALTQGTNKSTSQLSAVNGYFGNALVKIVFPPKAQKAETILRSAGLGKLCDNVILSMNRAAEDAAKQAEPIFVNAITHMTITDANNILLGDKDAATQYFKRTTSPDLIAKFMPIIQASLGKTGATKYYSQAAKAYDGIKIPFLPKMDPDISAYVTQKAIDGLFIEIALEELKIRKDISDRSTPAMKTAFSFADKIKKAL